LENDYVGKGFKDKDNDEMVRKRERGIEIRKKKGMERGVKRRKE